MRSVKFTLALASLGALVAFASCTLITDVDRSKIPTNDASPGDAGEGNNGGSSGKGGSSSAGAAGVGDEAGSGGTSAGGAGGDAPSDAGSAGIAGEAGEAGSSSGGNGGSTGGTGGTGGTDATGGNVAAAGADDGTGGTSGGSGGGTSVDVPSDAPSACITTSSTTTPQKIGVYFLLIDGSKMSAGQASWQATYKLTSSAPPDAVSAKTGENSAPITWSYNSTSADTYINGYQFYCDPAPGEGVVEDPDILPTTCPASEVLKPGTRPANKYKCGTADKTSQRGNATGLVNNVPYNVAVATTDTYRNVGVISGTACAIPQPVTGFFEAYRNAGGEGGGGFCSFSRHGRPLVLLTVFGLGLCLVLRRRRAT